MDDEKIVEHLIANEHLIEQLLVVCFEQRVRLEFLENFIESTFRNFEEYKNPDEFAQFRMEMWRNKLAKQPLPDGVRRMTQAEIYLLHLARTGYHHPEDPAGQYPKGPDRPPLEDDDEIPF